MFYVNQGVHIKSILHLLILNKEKFSMHALKINQKKILFLKFKFLINDL